VRKHSVGAGQDDELRARQIRGIGELGVDFPPQQTEAQRPIEHQGE
jgi:hypothetical protein